MSSDSEVKLSDIASFQNGGGWTADKYSDSGIPVVRVSDIHNETIDLSDCKYLPERLFDKYKRHELKEDDLVVCTVGSHPTQPNSVVGGSCRVPSKANGAFLNQNAVRIRPAIDKLDKIYLAYLGASDMMRNHIIAHARGSASQVRMSIGNLKKFTFELPPIETQQKIASILSAFDDLIENNSRRIDILEEMARRIYREWFVHFRYPGHENDELVDSGTELGEIPEGWEVKKLKDFLKFKNGKSPETKEGEKYPVYGSNGIIGKCNEPGWEDGIIIGRVGAYCGSVEYCAEKFWGSDNTIVATPKEDYNFPLFSYYKLEDLNLRRYAGGSAQPLMTQTVIKDIKTVIPNNELLKQFGNQARKLWEFKRNLEKKNEKLKETRDLLLPKLISGKIEV